jgi:high-affinity nickel permease
VHGDKFSEGCAGLPVGTQQVKRPVAMPGAFSLHIPSTGFFGGLELSKATEIPILDVSASRGMELAMKLDQIALAIVIVYAIGWVLFTITGLLVAVPFGFLGLIPLAIVGGMVVMVIIQRLNNKEDDYYDKNVDK